MNIERSDEQDYGSANAAGGEARQRTNAAEALVLLVTILALIGLAAAIAIRFPWVLENVTTHAYASQELAADSPAQEPLQAPEETDGPAEPLIVDDLRVAGLIYAASAIACSSTRAIPDSSTLT